MTSVVKKDGVTIKATRAYVRNVGLDNDIAEFLSNASEYEEYTIRGIMHELKGVRTSDMGGSWGDWPRGLPTLYGQVNRALERLKAAGKVTKTRKGKADFWAWNGAEGAEKTPKGLVRG